MKVLVLGAYGMLGHRLFMEICNWAEVVGTCRWVVDDDPVSRLIPADRLLTSVDSDRFESVQEAISSADPDAVVNCIGIVRQLKAALDPVRSIRTNSLFPHMLARECSDRGMRLVHFSTDCVFSGTKGMYTLEDKPDATDLYGRTKLLGEVAGKGCATIRSSLVGRELRSANGLIEWFLRSKGAVKGYRHAVFSGLTTTEMSRVVHLLLAEHAQLSGIRHVASKPISKYDLLMLVRDRMGLDVRIEEDKGPRIDRSLDGSVFQRETGYVAPSWGAMVEEMAREALQYGPISAGRR